MMKVLAAVFDFFVGDDWRLAVGAVAAVALGAALSAWWVLPPVVAATLVASLRAATRPGRGR